MGFLISKVIEFFSRSKDNFKIILLGLQNAGKTTILYRLSLGQLVKTQPTIGSNVEEISHNNVKFQAWDLGGQESMRSVWDVYYSNTDAVVFVIDSADLDNYEESKKEFYKLLKNEELKSAVILIFANKQDLIKAKKVTELIQIYDLHTIKDHIWHIQPCSAETGEGLLAGIKWLSDQLVFKKNTRFPRNPYISSKYTPYYVDNYVTLDQETKRTDSLSQTNILGNINKNGDSSSTRQEK